MRTRRALSDAVRAGAFGGWLARAGLWAVALLVVNGEALAWDFVIEAEDFNYNSGASSSVANTMPYYGGAYNGLGATFNVDYANNDGLESDLYRTGESPNVDMTPNADVDRNGWTVTTNYRIGWIDPADWFNYTRTFPAGYYYVYAALSHSSTAAHMLAGSLQQVTSGASTTSQTLQPLGSFDAPGSGAWGLNNLVPLKDGGGNVALLNLQGAITLRYSAASGDYDYLAFQRLLAPQITQQPANTSVVEDGTAVFSLQLASTISASYQWQRNTNPITGATNASYVLYPVALSNNNAQYRCFVSNPVGNTTSSAATLTVSPDVTPPSLALVQNIGSNTVEVIFSEAMEAASGTNKNNYVINNGVTVSAAVFGGDLRTILLTTSPLTYGNSYVLTVNNVRDRAATPNPIAANSQSSFVVNSFTPLDIGSPSPAGGAVLAGNGLDVSGGGADIGGSSDQFQFSYQPFSGNFDVAVRVQGLSLADTWSKAGLMARETLDPTSRFASTMTTPSVAGTFFEYRDTIGAAANLTGSFPANYPNGWLRLQRAGDTYTGLASFDGQNWVALGSMTVALSANLYVGFAVSSHNSGQTSTAQFRDFQNVSGGTIGAVSLPTEPLGPSTRKTGLVISEIMYKPAPRIDLRNLEYLELYNSNPFFEDISGYRISGDIDYTFPSNTVLAGGAFVVIGAVPGDIQAVYGVANVVGPYTNTLKKSSLVQLLNQAGAVYLEVLYTNAAPWPVGADGTGHSIVLARPSYGEGDGRAWAISDVAGGSPGVGEAYRPSPLRNVVINELLAHTNAASSGYVELYNHSNVAVDLSGCILSDDPVSNKFVIAASTIIPARGFLSFSQTQLGFGLNAGGGHIYFKKPDASRILDAVFYGDQAAGVALGRFPDGATEFYPLTTRTPGAANSPILVRDVVINEIMYDPISVNKDDTYVELYNQGSNAVNLSGWKFSAGINYSFPSNTVIGTNGYLVIARNLTNLLAHYPNLNSNNTLGNFTGSLPHGGGRLALAMTDLEVKTNNLGQWVTNTIHPVADEVTYGAGGRWGQWAAKGGSSLELIDPRSNHRLAYNWADSDETGKAPWTNIEAVGVLDNGAGYNGGPIDLVQIGLLEVGECLVDNIELLPGTSGANYISNSDFESGLTGWTPQGCHSRSSLETSGGYLSSQCLHIRNSDKLWTGNNCVQGALNNTTLAAGQTATLRFKARWLKGWPEPLIRVHGNWLEATGPMAIPANLGTPGLPNSRARANTGPAIYEVTHAPTLPAANQSVAVTARFHDPNGLQSATLYYRIDPATTYTAVPFVDNGAGGDAIANDGTYSASIPGQGTGTMVAFYIQATDVLGATTKFPADRNDNNLARECLVLFGDATPTSAFGSYHMWFSQANLNRWISLGDLSNESMDGTWVYGNRVIYNMMGRYSGSPYHQQFDSPVGSPCHYRCDMPEDDQFLGTTSFSKIHAPGNGPYDDDTIQREQAFYWIERQMGLPWNYRRYVNVYVNGVHRVNGSGTGMMEDTQVPNGDVVKEDFPTDTNGDLYKLQPWFEFDVNGSGFSNNSWCMLDVFTTTGGVKKLARYRYNYLIRKIENSASRYTNVFNLVDAANLPANSPQFIQSLEAQADVEQWMRTFACSHSVGDWDHVGTQNAQNMYAYKPTLGPWQMLLWDCNIVLGNSGSWGPGQNLFTITGGDQGMANIYNTIVYQRAFWRALKEIATFAMDPNRINVMMEAKYAAFLANGVNVTSPQTAVEGWIASARSIILSQLATANGNAAFAVNGPASFSTNNNLITLSGTAPVEVKTITVNGVAFPATWSDLATWNLQLALAGGANAITIQGYDIHGNLVSGATSTLNINYTGPAELPQARVLINEIMYNPVVVGAEFVELYNSSTVDAFDLSTFRLDGAGFAFPGGAIIRPNGFLVVVRDPVVFAITYGNTIPIAGVFNGNLDNGGGTLTLVKPGATPAQDVVIDEVSYDSVAPWPAAANGFGPSLQLIDPTQDNRRVANWAAVTTNTPPPPLQWQYVTVSGVAASSSLFIYLQTAGDVYIDDVKLVAGNVPEFGPNLLLNGDFESGSFGPWVIGTNGNNSASVVSSALKHSGNYGLHLIASSGGTTTSSAIYQDISSVLTQGATYTLSFWYFPSTNGGPLTVRLANSNNAHPPVRADVNIAPPTIGTILQYTPGARNALLVSLPTFPLLWLNEVQPNNVTGSTDRFGHHHPWVELYNNGTNTINLSGYYLANNYTNLTQWAFPSNTAINSGQFMVVYVDGNTNESINTELHTSFAIPSVSGSVALTQVLSNQTTMVVDYLNFNQISAERSYGAYPDGTPTHRQRFYFPTPGAPNTNGYPALPIFINEWMAANSTTILDPADGKSDDWFELYNAGGAPVDLTGYTLTDSSTNTTKSVIPAGYSVPAGGYLLVWADKETNQNIIVSPDLHVNFHLGKTTGGFIGLYAPNGTNVDAVSFGPQTSDISQGRWPDGNAPPFVFMTTPTPQAANIYRTSTNAPPVLAAIGNKTVNELTLLTFTASASDPDSGETLTFSLDAGAPAGTTINAASGVFTWTPTEAQGPGVYPVTVRVTDNGTPRMSDFETINITVNEVNTAPVLGPVSNQTVNEGTLLSFTVTASDADIPANTLTFSLDPGAPAGASINPITGVFSWTPPRGFSPATNVVTIRVTDNGVPPRSDAATVQIVVVSAPRISGITRSSTNVVNITWQTSPGKTYRVQYTSSLSPSTWTTLGSDIVATGSTASKQDTPGAAVQRFYRVIQLN